MFLSALGAMTGDAIGAFIKRRLNMKPGQAAPILDQWDFVFGALAFALIFSLTIPSLEVITAILILTIINFIRIGRRTSFPVKY